MVEVMEPIIPPLSRRILLLLRLSQARVEDMLIKKLDAISLQPNHCSVLAYLEQNDCPCLEYEAWEALRMTPIDFRLLSFELHDRGMVIRKCQRTDITIEITALGRTMLAAASDLSEDTLNAITQDLGLPQFKAGMEFLYLLSGLRPLAAMVGPKREPLQFKSRSGTK